MDKLILKFIRKFKEPKTAELTLLKNVAEDLALPAFKAGIKQTIKAARCSRKEHASAEESPHACATSGGRRGKGRSLHSGAAIPHPHAQRCCVGRKGGQGRLKMGHGSKQNTAMRSKETQDKPFVALV